MTINHDCKKTGECYLIKHTPDWGFLDNAFSGKIKVTDLDGAVEANGCLLILEWKAMNAPMLNEERDSGQTIMFKKVTRRSDVVVYVIFGDTVNTISEKVRVFKDGEITYDGECSNEMLFKACANWEKVARGKI